MRIPIILFLFLTCVVYVTAANPEQPQEMPKVKKRVDPQYPQILKLAGIEGEVEIRAHINAEGRVENAELVKATNRDFIPAALDAMKQWEFYPATKDGKAIKAEVVIPFVFRKGAGSYKARFDDVLAFREMITDILRGDISDSLKAFVDMGAYAIIGNRYEHLYSIMFDQSKKCPLTEGRDTKPSFSSTVVDDSEDSAYFIIKTNPLGSKADRYHSIMLMKSPDGRWRIRGWHTGG